MGSMQQADMKTDSIALGVGVVGPQKKVLRWAELRY